MKSALPQLELESQETEAQFDTQEVQRIIFELMKVNGFRNTLENVLAGEELPNDLKSLDTETSNLDYIIAALNSRQEVVTLGVIEALKNSNNAFGKLPNEVQIQMITKASEAFKATYGSNLQLMTGAFKSMAGKLDSLKKLAPQTQALYRIVNGVSPELDIEKDSGLRGAISQILGIEISIFVKKDPSKTAPENIYEASMEEVLVFAVGLRNRYTDSKDLASVLRTMRRVKPTVKSSPASKLFHKIIRNDQGCPPWKSEVLQTLGLPEDWS